MAGKLMAQKASETPCASKSRTGFCAGRSLEGLLSAHKDVSTCNCPAQNEDLDGTWLMKLFDIWIMFIDPLECAQRPSGFRAKAFPR